MLLNTQDQYLGWMPYFYLDVALDGQNIRKKNITIPCIMQKIEYSALDALDYIYRSLTDIPNTQTDYIGWMPYFNLDVI